MSFSAMAWVWDLAGVSPSQKLVLIGIANCHNEATGIAYPSIMYLSQKTGLDRKTVMKAIADLEQQGILSRKLKRGENTIYILNMPGTKSGTRPVPKVGLDQYQ